MRVNTLSDRALERTDRAFYKVTTSDDPIIRELAKGDVGKADAEVFATDAILSVLMCATKSVFPWDVVVTKIGTKIFIDKRDNSQVAVLRSSSRLTILLSMKRQWIRLPTKRDRTRLLCFRRRPHLSTKASRSRW